MTIRAQWHDLLAIIAVGMLAVSPVMARDGDEPRRIGHVFIIVLENEGFDITFGADSAAPYLAKTLPAQGAMLNQYFATGHVSLDNYIAMISGQAATPETRTECQIYQDFKLTGIT